VVDDGSTDEAVSVLGTSGERITLLQQDKVQLQVLRIDGEATAPATSSRTTPGCPRRTTSLVALRFRQAAGPGR